MLLNKINLDKKTIAIICLSAFLVSVLIFAVILFFQNKSLKQKYDSRLNKSDRELNLCVNDKAELKNSYTISYPNSDFKITSSLFDGKEITVKDWFYKGDGIKEYTITFNKEGVDYPITIEYWDYVNVKYNHLAYFDENGNSTNFALPNSNARIFTTTGNDLKTVYSWQEEWGELWLSKSITSIHSVLVRVIGNRMGGEFIDPVANKVVRQIVQEITLNF